MHAVYITVIGSLRNASRIIWLTTRPSSMCMRGPNVLKMRATRMSTPPYQQSQLHWSSCIHDEWQLRLDQLQIYNRTRKTNNSQKTTYAIYLI